jgi:hypothetical protein
MSKKLSELSAKVVENYTKGLISQHELAQEIFLLLAEHEEAWFKIPFYEIVLAGISKGCIQHYNTFVTDLKGLGL